MFQFNLLIFHTDRRLIVLSLGAIQIVNSTEEERRSIEHEEVEKGIRFFSSPALHSHTA